MSAGTDQLGLMEPRAEELSRQLHRLASQGNKVTDVNLAAPSLLSIAISMKRLADHFTPMEGRKLSQAESNINDVLRDRLGDLAKGKR